MELKEVKEKQKKLFQFTNKVKVIWLEDVPGEWVGVDLKTYPPVKKGDIMLLDKETAKLLEKAGRLEILEE